MIERIAIFSALYPPHMGGVEQFTENIAGALVELGVRVCVVANNTEGMPAHELDDRGVEVVRLPCRALAGGRFPVPRHGREHLELRRLLDGMDIDGILVNTRFYPLSLYALRFARRRGIRPVVLDHGSGYLGFGDARIDWLVRSYEQAMTRLASSYPADFYGVSEGSVAWLSQLGISGKGVIHNAIDADAFRRCSSGRDLRSELGIAPEAPLVAFAGRLVRDKGPWRVLEVARRAAEAGRDAIFVLAGEGPELDALRASAPANAHLVGRLSREDMSALLAQADAFLFPSTYPEGLPTSLLEAAACACAIVTTDVAGARDIVPDASHGIVVDRMADDLDDRLARATLELLDDPASRRAMGKACRRHVEEAFSWESSARALLAACEQANSAATRAGESA